MPGVCWRCTGNFIRARKSATLGAGVCYFCGAARWANLSSVGFFPKKRRKQAARCCDEQYPSRVATPVTVACGSCKSACARSRRTRCACSMGATPTSRAKQAWKCEALMPAISANSATFGQGRGQSSRKFRARAIPGGRKPAGSPARGRVTSVASRPCNAARAWAKLFLKEENRKNYSAIILFPQCPENSFWSSVNIDRNKTPLTFEFNYDNTITWPLAAVQMLVNQLLNEESIDKKRCYITGLSMGGMGTFEMLYRFPMLFAAAMPICGGGDALRYDERIKKTSFWIFHGDADVVVNVNESRAMVNKLKELKVTVTYTEYPAVNHNSWDNAFAEPTFLKWMFSNKRKNRKAIIKL